MTARLLVGAQDDLSLAIGVLWALYFVHYTSSDSCILSVVSPVAGGLLPLYFILRSTTAGLELVLPCGHPVHVSRYVPVHAVHPVRGQLPFSLFLAITSSYGQV